jgi:hypothetical protein
MKNTLGIAFIAGVLSGPLLAYGNEPSALELRQMQTRVFQAKPAKLQGAMLEFCQNLGGSIAVLAWNSLPEHNCMSIRWEGAHAYLKYTLSQDGTSSTLIRVRLTTFRPASGGFTPSTDPSHYESIFKAIGDMLVLNEVGVEIKVFK